MAKANEIPSKFKNGWLDQLDGRTGIAQLMQARYDEMTNDLGGSSNLSYMQRSLIERALWLEFFLAQQEQALATGQEFNIAQWIQGANSLQGLLSKLGLERKQRDPVNLSDFLKAKAAN